VNDAILTKVPAITFAFWVMKICATTLGETGGDMVSMTFNAGYAASSLILISIFLVTLVAQLSAKAYHPLLYWLVILSTSTAGTTMSDYMDRTLHLGYPLGATLLATILASILIVWRLTLGSLKVDNIRSFRVEIFYWTAILASNTLGTALGDFLSDSSGLGFSGGAALIAGLLAAITLAHFFTPAPKTLLFWLAFVLTRPFGATLGDLLTKTNEKGGLGFGTIWASATLGAVLIFLILFSPKPAPVRVPADDGRN
jgi:uncharacterized membrane-anchored protein